MLKNIFVKVVTNYLNQNNIIFPNVYKLSVPISILFFSSVINPNSEALIFGTIFLNVVYFAFSYTIILFNWRKQDLTN